MRRCVAVLLLAANAAAEPAARRVERRDAPDGCKAVTVGKKVTCEGSCAKINSTCELLDPTDPTTGCMCKMGPAPLPPVCWLPGPYPPCLTLVPAAAAGAEMADPRALLLGRRGRRSG